jgi:hypothetical protein
MTDKARRYLAVACSAVALSLTVWGLIIAATDTNVPSTDALALHGTPPSTARVLVTLSGQFPATLTAQTDIDFSRNALESDISASGWWPVQVATAYYDGDHPGQIDLRLGGASTWSAIKGPNANLFGLSLEFTHPDIDLIAGFNSESITHVGYETRYEFSRTAGVLPQGGVGPVTLAITTGSTGEVVGVAINYGRQHPVSLTLTVESYNQPVNLGPRPTATFQSNSAEVAKIQQAITNDWSSLFKFTL